MPPPKLKINAAHPPASRRTSRCTDTGPAHAERRAAGSSRKTDQTRPAGRPSQIVTAAETAPAVYRIASATRHGTTAVAVALKHHATHSTIATAQLVFECRYPVRVQIRERPFSRPARPHLLCVARQLAFECFDAGGPVIRLSPSLAWSTARTGTGAVVDTRSGKQAVPAYSPRRWGLPVARIRLWYSRATRLRPAACIDETSTHRDRGNRQADRLPRTPASAYILNVRRAAPTRTGISSLASVAFYHWITARPRTKSTDD